MLSITLLNKNGDRETYSRWEETDRGVIVPVGAASEVLIPWRRVLEIGGGRNEINRD